MRWVGRALIVLLVLVPSVAGCTSGTSPGSGSRPSAGSGSGLSAGPASAPSTDSADGTPAGPEPPPTLPRSPSAPRSPTAPPGSATRRAGTLHPGPAQLTKQGLWWAVDSTVAVDARSLHNVLAYYRGHHRPAAWGRYLTGGFAISRAEIAFAAREHIALYLLVPDGNCSGCGGGDACGQDRTAGQADADARVALAAARRLRLPAGVALFKDIEEVSSCHGELTGEYLDAWYRRVRGSPYRPAFYGNSTARSYDFPRAFCAAARRDPAFAGVLLAQDEPEPAIGASRGATGPGNAPPFAPRHPRCVSVAAVHIWQYGESLSDDNVTDVDEIRPGTPGLLTPDGSVTGPLS